MVHDVANKLYPEEFKKKKKAKAASPKKKRRRKQMLCVLLVILIIAFAMHIYYYNKFVSMRYDVEAADANIGSLLQMRRNICINLTTTVLDYAKHEKEIFKHVSEIRAQLVRGEDIKKGMPKEKELKDLEKVLSKILAIAEQYPDLKLSQNFQQFMTALVNSETRIAENRIYYNNNVNAYTTAINQFPGSVFAHLWGFKMKEFFMPTEDARKFKRIDY